MFMYEEECFESTLDVNIREQWKNAAGCSIPELL